MIIYKITNKLNGKCYIGQTVKSLSSRIKEHFSKYSCCPYIKYALQKYGKENFCIEEIAVYSNLEDLNNAEEYYIDWYNCIVPNGYNLKAGGYNKKLSEETKEKISRGNIGKALGRTPHNKGIPQTQETKRKLSLSNKGKRNSPNTEFKAGHQLKRTLEWNKRASLAKLGNKNPMFNKKPSKETIQKRSISLKAAWARRKEKLNEKV